MLSKLNHIPVHFILCTERSGSSLLSLMLNLHPRIISPSEEPFAVFFYNKYKNKISWKEEEVKNFVDEFWLMAEKNLDLFFTTKEKLYDCLILYKDHLPYSNLMKLIYLNFLEPKDKSDITVIVDKQIKYFFYLPELIKIFPDAKFIILVRDVRDNIISKSNRNLNNGSSALYLASLWKNTYRQINFLQKHRKEFITAKYEDLVSDPDSTLQKICDFVNVKFDSLMLETNGKYEQFLNIKRSSVESKEIARLENFQSNLFKPVTKSHIGTFVDRIDPVTLSKIERHNSKLFHAFGYTVFSKTPVSFNFADYYRIFRAWLYRPLLLRIYLRIPLGVKLLIKKTRK